MGRTCHLLVFYSIYSSIILCLMCETIVQQQCYIDIQSSGSSSGANAFLRLDAWNHSRWRFFVYFFGGGFSDVYSAASLFCVSVVIMGFYLFSWHTEEGFHRAFCCLPYYFLPCPCCCRDTSLAPRGEFLHDQPHSTFLLFPSQYHSPLPPPPPPPFLVWLSASSTALLPHVCI